MTSRLVKGDKTAIDGFVREYSPRLFAAFATLCEGNESDAEDLTFRTLEAGYSKIAGFRGKSSLFSWLYRIGYNFRLMDRRSKAKRAEHLMPELPESIPDTRKTPTESVEKSTEADRLEKAIAALPEKMRDVVNLRFYDDLDIAEIASCLGISIGTVKSRLHYALARLRELLQGGVK